MAPREHGRFFRKVVLLVALLAAMPVLGAALRPIIQRQIWERETREAFRTGLFPECKRKIEAYFGGDNSSIASIKPARKTIIRRNDTITGMLDISFTLRSGGDMTPSQGAQAYVAGVASGIDSNKMADAVTERMKLASDDYDKRIEFVYRVKSDSCNFGKRVTDLRTGEVDSNDIMTSLMNDK